MEQNRGNLEYLETFTLAEFKAKFNISADQEDIQVLPNPKTGKVFMTFNHGRGRGSVSAKIVERKGSEHPMVSLVKGAPTPENPKGEPFFLLHDQGESADVLFSL